MLTSIEVRHLRKKYGPLEVLNDVGFTLNDGEFLTILGPSGSGKTTMLGAIAGFVEPDDGDILVGGSSILHLQPRFRNLGVVFQSYALFPYLTVCGNVEFGLRMRNVRESERRRRVDDALQQVGLAGFSQRFPNQLSGGQQQRVALARALVVNPSALLLDEPLGALDRRLRQRVGLELKNIQRNTGVPVLNVTHDQEEAMIMSDRLIVMNEGRVEQIDTPVSVYKYPHSVFVANFLGEANFLPVSVLENNGSTLTVEYEDHSLGSVRAPRRYAVTKGCRDARVCIRPECLKLATKNSDSYENSLEGVFVSSLHLGSSVRYIIRALNRDLIISSGDSAELARFEPGSRVTVRWKAEDSQLLLH